MPPSLLMGLFLSVPCAALCKVYFFQPMLPDLLRYLRCGSWCLKYPQTRSSFLWCLHTCGTGLTWIKPVPKVRILQIGSAHSFSLMSPTCHPFLMELSTGMTIIRDLGREWNTWKYEIGRNRAKRVDYTLLALPYSRFILLFSQSCFQIILSGINGEKSVGAGHPIQILSSPAASD